LDADGQGGFTVIGQPGKFRCSYLGGFDKQRPLKPGKVYQCKFRIWDTTHQFAKGHRVCLFLTSEMFPVYARNMGTIEPIATGKKMVVQDQKIFHDAKNPSSITFQVIR
jgi:predicted acyl esterase